MITSPQSSNLDIGRFAKIYAHVTRNDNPGERDNARRKAEAMAVRAGMTFDEAVSKLDAHTSSQSSGFYYDFDDAAAAAAWARQQQQAQQRKEEAQMHAMREEARRNREKRYKANAGRRAEVLKRYRTVFDVFEQTDREHKLRKAVSSFSTFRTFTDPSGKERRFTSKMDKVSGDISLEKISKRIRRAVQGAYPWPETFADAIIEVKLWDQLRIDRDAFDKNEWQHDLEVEARVLLLEDMLRTVPVKSWDDMEARFDWDVYDWERQWLNPDEHTRLDDEIMKRLRADFEILRASSTNPPNVGTPMSATHQAKATPADATPTAQNGQRRTNADKAADVQALLRSCPDLSDREISRRAGVSPQTVSNWRSRMKGDSV